VSPGTRRGDLCHVLPSVSCDHARASGPGEIERPLQGAPGGGRVAERVARRRLQQQSRHHRERLGPDGAVDDGRERGRSRLRIVLGKPQRRQGGAYLWAPALVFVQRGEGGFDALGLAPAVAAVAAIALGDPGRSVLAAAVPARRRESPKHVTPAHQAGSEAAQV